MSTVPDLTQTEWWHTPELAYSSSLPERFDAVMVGWLGDEVPTTGVVSDEIIEKLRWACDHHTIDQGWLGEHECGICQSYSDHGEVLIADGDKMYVAPRMILHYVEAHAYCPPQEFLDAVAQIETTTDTQAVSPPSFYICKQCGGPMKQVSPPDSSPLIMECRRCHHREYAEILVPPPWSSVEQTAYRLVVHRAEGPAKAPEVRALRKLRQELRNLPVHVAAERIGASTTIDLGTHSTDVAQDLLKQAMALGLKAELVEPSVSFGEQQFFEPFGAPATVGEPGEGQVIPFIWILIGALLVAAIVWLLW
ncbi:MAG: hypothetical protein GY792_37100 [Gammaproteobacteria bacterium]|nr:hypothetical protein [Gammaproteobacteria bacterium]